MADSAAATYHALLVGIDAYDGHRRLKGCVNDIDAVQRILLRRVGLLPAQIRRLASPNPDATPAAEVPALPATLANLRAELAGLAARAAEGDRVFIYYAGHGTRARVDLGRGRVIYREAIVPVDFDEDHPQALLFDHELNQLLAGIAARTRSVAVVLDCCHSAGVTRSAPGGLTPRSFPIEHVLGPSAPPIQAPPEPPPPPPGRPWLDDCLVASACMHHEHANEEEEAGVTYGLLTRAFVRAVEAAGGPPRDLTWARLWQAMRAEVEGRNPSQHLWLVGDPARAVFAGPPVDGDPGFPIRRAGAGDAYEIEAGAFAQVTEGAQIAVYDERTPRFPAIGSPEDLAARRGLLVVTSATSSTAAARPANPAFALPPGARGRLVAAGALERLRCAVLPPEPRLVAALRASPLLAVVEPDASQVRLVRVDGRWLLADDLHRETPDQALFALTEGQLGFAREVLEHYAGYARPLRFAAAVGNRSPLELRVVSCPRHLSPQAAQEADLPEAPTTGRGAYVVPHGFQVCFRVHNTSSEKLLVTLVNSAASGKVQHLGKELVEPRADHVFWYSLGTPFAMMIPDGRRQCIDRLTAIGTNAPAKDVDFLRLDYGFEQIVNPTRGGRPVVAAKPGERWTAAQAIVTTRKYEYQEVLR